MYKSSSDKYYTAAKPVKKRWHRELSRIEIMLLFIMLIYLFPFYIVLTLSLKTPAQALNKPIAFPKSAELKNYIKAWGMMKYHRAFLNSVIVTIVSNIEILCLAGMASFTIVRTKSKFIKTLYYFFLSGLMVPFYMTLTPLLKLMKDLHLLNNIFGLVLAYMGRCLPLAIFLYVGFIKTIPIEISESAIIDGCRPFRLYWFIYFPMLRHVSATVLILNVIFIWNDFLFPMLTLTGSANHTIPVSQFVFYGEGNTQYNLLFASYVLSIAPLLFFYLLMQKHIITGISAGAVKG